MRMAMQLNSNFGLLNLMISKEIVARDCFSCKFVQLHEELVFKVIIGVFLWMSFSALSVILSSSVTCISLL